MADFSDMTVKELRKGLDAGDFTSVELTKHCLKVIKEKNDEINAFLEVFDDAIEQAEKADELLKAGDGQALTGIPIAIKDNILIEGRIVSAASKILENYTASYDAFVIEKLKAQSAVFIGRTNMDEFAMGSSTEHSAFGDTKNPHDLERVPGGSSGGSAAAIAMGGVPIALGSDTAGSVRQPASFCGVVGLKPTYGGVSRSGLIAMGSSLDVIGPLGKSIEDVETVYNIIKGQDPKDSTSYAPDTYEAPEVKEKMIIGVPRTLFEGISSDVLEHFESTIEQLEKEGHEVKDVALPHIEYSLPSYYIVIPAEVSTNLARLDGMRYGLHEDGVSMIDDYLKSREAGFGPETKRRILVGAYVLSSGYYDAYYAKANAVRKLITKDFEEAFKHCDVIATPTAPTPPFKLGEVTDPVSMYLGDIFTVPANIAGIPGMSIPVGMTNRHNVPLPVGFQILAPHRGEEVLFTLGKQIETMKP